MGTEALCARARPMECTHSAPHANQFEFARNCASCAQTNTQRVDAPDDKEGGRSPKAMPDSDPYSASSKGCFLPTSCPESPPAAIRAPEVSPRASTAGSQASRVHRRFRFQGVDRRFRFQGVEGCLPRLSMVRRLPSFGATPVPGSGQAVGGVCSACRGSARGKSTPPRAKDPRSRTGQSQHQWRRLLPPACRLLPLWVRHGALCMCEWGERTRERQPTSRTTPCGPRSICTTP